MRFARITCLLSLLLVAACRGAETKPNIILILADDLGWSDLGCYSSEFYRTPNLDRLAREGMRFTDAYAAAPVCSPTRAAILTGKHPARLRVTDWLPGRDDRPDQKLARPKIRQRLPLEEITLAEVLKSAGYATAHIGKWHLGGSGFGPEQQGFDVNIAGDQSGSPASYFAPFRNSQRPMRGLEQSEPGEYLTDRLTLEAEKFIERNKDRPFLLYLPHYAVHIPLRAKTNLVAKYQSLQPGRHQTNAIYAAMTESLDDSVGRIVKKLETLGIADRTIVIFTSDNGGLSVREGPNTPATSNHPLRAGKGYLHEGGIRVPLIVTWPGVVRAGSVSHAPVISMDLFPTILAMVEVRFEQSVDGVDLTPVLKGASEVPARRTAVADPPSALPKEGSRIASAPDQFPSREGLGVGSRDTLYWHYPHYANQVRSPGAPAGSGPSAAIRVGDWKLIQHFGNGAHELYNLSNDIGEQKNLADTMPEKVLELGKKLFEWQNSVKAQWPTYNSEFKAQPIAQAADGSVLLHARDAVIRGQQVHYEPQPFKNTIGYWTRVEDWVSWDFEITKPGLFSVEVMQGCGKGSGDSEVEASVGDQVLKFTVRDTGHFQNFVARDIGRFTLVKPSRYTLTVRPKSKPGVAVMDLRQVTLRPISP